MKEKQLRRREPLHFKHFTRTGYALFSCLGKEVLIGVLSISTLTYAKADGVSTHEEIASDTVYRSEQTLDEVTVTGSRAPMTQMQTAKLVTVISRDDVHRAAAQTVNDVLKMATGVDVRQRGGFGIQTDISINGGTFDQIAILLNGIPLTNPQTGHNAADFPVSLSDIERIEVLEGASARITGSTSFGGAVNIVTRMDKENALSAAAEGGSFGTMAGDAAVGIGQKNHRHLISGGYTQSDGGTDNSDFRKRRAFYAGIFTSKEIRLQWQAGITSQDFGANTFYSAKYANQYEATRRYMASVNGDFRIIDFGKTLKLSLRPQLYWHRDGDHYQLIRHSSTGENFHRTDVYGGGADLHFSWLGGRTSLGFSLQKDQLYSTSLGNAMDEEDWKTIHGADRNYDHKGSRTNVDFFAEHNLVIGRFSVSGGTLINHNTGLGSGYRFYPGIDLCYRPSGAWRIFASWNRAMRIPTYTDLYTSTAVQLGDVNLSPERNTTWKIGGEYRSPLFVAVLNAFCSRGTNMIDWVYPSSESTRYEAMNIGKLDNMGASVNFTLYPQRNAVRPLVTKVQIGYARLHQKHSTDREIYRSLYALEYLRHKVTATVDLSLASHLTATIDARWQQRMNGYHPYFKVDGRLQWQTPRYKVYVKADNLTAHRYYDLTAIPQPGLWVMAGVGISLKKG